jgi:uncharacterized membrane protein (UPF0127 family)
MPMPSNLKRKYRRTRDSFLAAIIFLLICVAFFGVDYYVSEQKIAEGVFVHHEGDGEKGTTPKFRFEIANDDRERARGLMYRKVGSMKEQEGMLFSFPRMAIQKFWMANTYLPLDMIFLDKDWKIVGVLENVPPLSRQRRFVDEESQYVIELNAGVAQKFDIEVGDSFKLRKGDVKAE